MLLALFGATAGQGVVWYTGQFYALFFLTLYLKLDYLTAYILIAVSLVLGTPFFIFFGCALRPHRPQVDHPGRAACIAALTYFPLFKALTHYVNPALERYAANDPDQRRRHGLQDAHLPDAEDGVLRLRQGDRTS